MKILFVGGGTAGSIAPLMAVAEVALRRDANTSILFIIGKNGPEKKLMQSANFPFETINAGKLRRYFSLQNIFDLTKIVRGFFESLRILRKFRPDIVVSAGSFVSVPVVWAAKHVHIPSLIHQQDIQAGLANKLCAPAATVITSAFEESALDYSGRKVVWTGNPVREEIVHGYSASEAKKYFNLDNELPVILAFGGSTGAQRLNELIVEAGLELTKHSQILHLTGGKSEAEPRLVHKHYHQIDFLTAEMGRAYAAADIVVCRAGLSTISELSSTAKPAVVVPLPNTHQEKNAELLKKRGAAIVLNEKNITHADIEIAIESLLENQSLRRQQTTSLRALNRPDAADRILSEIDAIVMPHRHQEIITALKKITPNVKENEPLSKHTNFKLGGPADVFVTAQNVTELEYILTTLKNHNTKPIILGGGANTVFPDAGIRGVVVQLRNEEFSVDGDVVTVGAGTNTGKAASKCLQAGLTGLEFIVGIYGTIGGAVRGNAGSFGTEMKDVVRSCRIMTSDGIIVTRSNAEMKFGYRDSVAKHEEVTILSVELTLEHGDVTAARKLIVEHSTYKRTHQPLTFPSAGCMFKNYTLHQDEKSLAQQFPEHSLGGKIPAWAFIAEVGLTGHRIGDIQISDQHGNFFINLGQGKAEHVVMLASLVKQKVRERFGIQLQEEVQFIGF